MLFGKGMNLPFDISVVSCIILKLKTAKDITKSSIEKVQDKTKIDLIRKLKFQNLHQEIKFC